MRNISVFYLKYFQFLEVNFSIYLNRRVFVMFSIKEGLNDPKHSLLIFLFVHTKLIEAMSQIYIHCSPF